MVRGRQIAIRREVHGQPAVAILSGLRTTCRMPENKTPTLSRHDYVQSLERGLSVLRAFNSEQSEMRLSEAAAEDGLTRPAARRVLLTPPELGYVRYEDGPFSLRPRVLDLVYAYLSGLSFA